MDLASHSQKPVGEAGRASTGAWLEQILTIDTHACRMASDLLGFFVVEDPAYEKYASGNDSQSDRDTNRRSHFFDQVEDHSHVLIPF